MAELIEVVFGLLGCLVSSDDKKDSGWRWVSFLVVLILGVLVIAFGWLLSR